jgi:2,3-bisphosphoglycerate-independent phosphoglycerate mutase
VPLIMVFIDGLGLGTDDPNINPLVTAEMPFIKSFLAGKSLTAKAVAAGITREGLVIRPTDTTLGVAGIPQSATGQTTLFTGVNAAKLAGRHINGFPTRALRAVIDEYSIFKVVNEAGQRAIFANTFTKEYFDIVARGKWRHSASTTAALAGNSKILLIPDLLNGEAVFQDITNEHLRERGYEAPLIEPEEAAGHLIKQAVKNDFTLFEYFQTDHCGHDQDWDRALLLLNRLDRFINVLATQSIKNEISLLIVSDHGNIEDLSIKPHTYNPVPTIVIGKNAMVFKEVSTLLDIYPKVLEFLGNSELSFEF